MQQPHVNLLPLTIGLDLGSQSTQCAIYDRDGKRIEERKVTTSRSHLTSLLKRFPNARVVMEVSKVRVLGFVLPSCGTKVFADKCQSLVPDSLQAALGPIFEHHPECDPRHQGV